MHAIRIPAMRLVLAAALALGCAAGLSKPAHADNGHRWGKQDHRHGHHHGRRHFDAHPGYGGRFDGRRGPRYHALSPPVRYRSYGGPVFHGSIVFRSAPQRLILAPPALPRPPLIIAPPPYGVAELGPVR
ncbi:MAG TPA: hypothetical protein VF460_14655 [Burkholderiales bacterium]